MKLHIPKPDSHGDCDVCSCRWRIEDGLPNYMQDWCNGCPCHSDEWVTGLLEHQPRDPWQALRDAGLGELELRAASGDR